MLAALVLTLGSARAQAALTRAIDAQRSTAQFSIEHIFVEHVVGNVPLRGGTVDVGPDGLIPLTVSAQLDATRIRTDEPDRDATLESSDYFDVKNYPTWTFTSTRIVASGARAFELDGTLTMHGVARPEVLMVRIAGDRDHPVYHATGSIDRHAFGMKGARLDPVIGNTADITLDIVLK